MTDAASQLVADLRAGGKPALARALSQIERAPDSDDSVALLDAAWSEPQGVVIGLTGPPGVGKSTLTDALIRAARARGRSVGVIAVDPSSRRTGGALLGDRTRLSTDPEDDGVFVRSMAARDSLGGLAALTFPGAALMRAVRDLVLIETVGVGQSETGVSDIADLTVFCVQPGSGDSLQFMKAGVMETPDLVLVTKADLGAPARRAAADAAGALSLAAAEGPPPPVLLVSASSGEGVEEALSAMTEAAAARDGALKERDRDRARAWLRERIADAFGRAGLQAAMTALAGDGDALDRPFSRARDLMRRLGSAIAPALAALKGDPGC